MSKTKLGRLLFRWSEKEGDFLISYPRKEDGGLVHMHLEMNDVGYGHSFVKELELRGYDIKTLRFSVDKVTWKYVVRPGPITSKNDGDQHHIGSGRLMKLYGVSPARCVVVPYGEYDLYPKEWPRLYPDFHGRYELPLSPRHEQHPPAPR